MNAAQLRARGKELGFETPDDDVKARAEAARVLTNYTNRLDKLKLSQQQEEHLLKIINDLLRDNSAAGDKAADTQNRFADATKEWEQQSAINAIKNKIKYYTSFAFSVQVVHQQLRKMFQTYKDVDAALTNISMVSGISREEMWSNVGVFNNLARELGTTTNEALEASKLYYQQGLETNEVLVLTEQSLKLAAIAETDAKTATNYLTTAINGFKLSAEEAVMVTDTWAELAGRTAVDVEELAVGISKVASIAQSAGMELQSTSAFLTQIIETTREAPETAGTALKTIIARFQELKKSSGALEDGVDANKVETALKTAGVALRDTTGQFRDFDDVILELSSKWDDLDRNTQRYIATIAAGSRQQSRFIALVDDYDSLVQNMSYAYDSAGAASDQFNTYNEGLSASLNRLKASWEGLYLSFEQGGTIVSWVVEQISGLLTLGTQIGLFPTTLVLAFAASIIRLGGAYIFAAQAEKKKVLELFKSIKLHKKENVEATQQIIKNKLLAAGFKETAASEIAVAFATEGLAAGFKKLLVTIGLLTLKLVLIGALIAGLVAVFNNIKKESTALSESSIAHREKAQAVREDADSYQELIDKMEEAIETGTDLEKNAEQIRQALLDEGVAVNELATSYQGLVQQLKEFQLAKLLEAGREESIGYSDNQDFLKKRFARVISNGWNGISTDNYNDLGIAHGTRNLETMTGGKGAEGTILKDGYKGYDVSYTSIKALDANGNEIRDKDGEVIYTITDLTVTDNNGQIIGRYNTWEDMMQDESLFDPEKYVPTAKPNVQDYTQAIALQYEIETGEDFQLGTISSSSTVLSAIMEGVSDDLAAAGDNFDQEWQRIYDEIVQLDTLIDNTFLSPQQDELQLQIRTDFLAGDVNKFSVDEVQQLLGELENNLLQDDIMSQAEQELLSYYQSLVNTAVTEHEHLRNELQQSFNLSADALTQFTVNELRALRTRITEETEGWADPEAIAEKAADLRAALDALTSAGVQVNSADGDDLFNSMLTYLADMNQSFSELDESTKNAFATLLDISDVSFESISESANELSNTLGQLHSAVTEGIDLADYETTIHSLSGSLDENALQVLASGQQYDALTGKMHLSREAAMVLAQTKQAETIEELKNAKAIYENELAVLENEKATLENATAQQLLSMMIKEKPIRSFAMLGATVQTVSELLSTLFTGTSWEEKKAAFSNFSANWTNAVAERVTDLVPEDDLSEDSELEQWRQEKIAQLDKDIAEVTSQINTIDVLIKGSANVDWNEFGKGSGGSSNQKSEIKRQRELLEKQKEILDAEGDAQEKRIKLIQEELKARKDALKEEQDAIKDAFEQQQKQWEIRLEYVRDTLEAEREALEEAANAAEDAAQKEIDAAKRAAEGKINLIQMQIDAMDEEADAENRLLELQKARDEYERARTSKTRLVLTRGAGWIFKTDNAQVEDAAANLKDVERDYQKSLLEAQIAEIEKVVESMEDVEGLLGMTADEIAAMNEATKKWSDYIINGTFADEVATQIGTSVVDSETGVKSIDPAGIAQAAIDASQAVANWAEKFEPVLEALEAAIERLGTSMEDMLLDTEAEEKILDDFFNQIVGAGGTNEILSALDGTMVEVEASQREMAEKSAEIDETIKQIEADLEAWDEQLDLIGLSTSEIEETRKQVEEFKAATLDELGKNGKYYAEIAATLKDLAAKWEQYNIADRNLQAQEDAEKGYSFGGVANFRGRAMLHGSTSRPEVVLNNSQAAALFNWVNGLGSNRYDAIFDSFSQEIGLLERQLHLLNAKTTPTGLGYGDTYNFGTVNIDSDANSIEQLVTDIRRYSPLIKR